MVGVFADMLGLARLCFIGVTHYAGIVTVWNAKENFDRDKKLKVPVSQSNFSKVA